MITIHHVLAAGLATMAMFVTPARAALTSSFTASAEGWDVVTATTYLTNLNPTVQSTGVATHQAVGGNPGGYISALDPDTHDTLFRAPAAYLGNMSAFLNGTLSYSRIVDMVADYDGRDVILQGGGLTLGYDTAIPAAANSWDSIAVTLAPSAGWTNITNGLAATEADFQTVLASLTALYLTAEYFNGTVETGGIDSVSLTEVPEPVSALLLASAVGLTGLARKRRSGRGVCLAAG